VTISHQSKTFDCVQNMRQVRDKLSKEIEGLSHEELNRWLRSQSYTHPFLRRLAHRVAQQEESVGEASPRR
jgi:chemotaxis regulatin CheY-phosphate phosphatase CheZ